MSCRSLVISISFILRAAIDSTFEHRGTHPVPESVPAPSAAWAPVYARIAANDGLEWRTMAEVTRAVQSFLDPLPSGELGTWSFDDWAWVPVTGDG